MSLPTPAAPMTAFVKPSEIPAVAPLYARATHGEIAEICRAIPADDLAIQWDVALEFAALEGVQPGVRVSPEEVADRIAMLGGWVPTAKAADL